MRPGDLLGYVGDTGNARGTPPHLHYGLYRGGALNPYPRLAPPGGSDSLARDPLGDLCPVSGSES